MSESTSRQLRAAIRNACSLQLLAVYIGFSLLHRLVRDINVGSQTILAGPVGILRHLELFFDLIERFALRRHLAYPLEQQVIKGFVLVKDFYNLLLKRVGEMAAQGKSLDEIKKE